MERMSPRSSSANCVACHSANTKMGGLVLETFAELENGGQRGPAIVPGSPEQSPLYLMVAGEMGTEDAVLGRPSAVAARSTF